MGLILFNVFKLFLVRCGLLIFGLASFGKFLFGVLVIFCLVCFCLMSFGYLWFVILWSSLGYVRFGLFWFDVNFCLGELLPMLVFLYFGALCGMLYVVWVHMIAVLRITYNIVVCFLSDDCYLLVWIHNIKAWPGHNNTDFEHMKSQSFSQ